MPEKTTIDAVGIVDAISILNMGIQMGGEWYNIDKKQSIVKISEITNKIKELKKGSKIEIKLNKEGLWTDFVVLEEPKEEQNEKTLPPYVTLRELIDAAHKSGIESVMFEYRFVDYEKKVAHIIATVKTKQGTFTGSACKKMDDMEYRQKRFWLEVIESQSLSRALRFATNRGEISDVEIDGG